MEHHKFIRFDWAMKKLLRHKANFEILEGFLSELFRFDVKIETILESEANKEDEYDKYNRVDILVKNDKDELMLVEMQQDSEIDYFHRMLYGTSKLVTQYLKQGEPYGKIKRIFSVHIVYFELGQGSDYVYESEAKFIGLHSQEVLQANFAQKTHFQISSVADIFPRYYILKINNFNKVAENTLDEWIYFLKNSDVKENFRAKGLEAAKERMAYERLSPIEKAQYDKAQENEVIARSVKFTAHFEGIAEGRAKGLAEGKEKGLAEGKLQKSIELARKLLAKGLSHQEIMDLTDLTIEQIKML